MAYSYILQIQQNYTFEILRPLQQAILAEGGRVLWLVLGKAVNTQLFHEQENFTTSIKDAVAFKPNAVFVTGNEVPDFIPGIKVQLFHGFEWKKKGHFRIRGGFDLYCTQGPFFTERFEKLAQEHGYFDVVQTGWPKLDSIFPLATSPSNAVEQTKNILYVPTFSRRFCSADALHDPIEAIAKTQDWHWHIKFHPKMDAPSIARYRELASKHSNITYHEGADVLALILDADIVLSDTSSVIAEALLLRKPVATLNNALPDEFINNFDDANQLQSTLQAIFTHSEGQAAILDAYAANYHPYADGKSSQRVLEATKQRINSGLDATGSKPKNIMRNLKLRKRENYWPWS